MKLLGSIFLLLTSLSVMGQATTTKSSEIGLFGGGGFYLGELNHTVFPIKATNKMLGAVLRHNANPRVSYKASFLLGSISGDDANSSDLLDRARGLNFKSILYEGSFQVEFNYFTFDIGNKKNPFTNYLFGGISIFKFKPQGNTSGSWEDLRDLATEYQKKKYSLIQPAIPFGAGAKVNIGKRFTASAEWGMRLTFTDYLDDVSTIYPNTLLQRGDSNSNDWYSFAGLMLSYVIKDPNTCPPITKR